MSAPGCFGFRPRKATLANLNKKGIYRRDAGRFTEPKKAEIRVPEKGGSQLPWGLIAAAPQGCSLGWGGGEISSGFSPFHTIPHELSENVQETAADWLPEAPGPGPGSKVGRPRKTQAEAGP